MNLHLDPWRGLDDGVVRAAGRAHVGDGSWDGHLCLQVGNGDGRKI